MKLLEITKSKLVNEGMVEPNVLFSIRNVVARGKATNQFEFLVMTRLLQLLKNGQFYNNLTDPIQGSMSTSKELIDILRAMKPEEITKVATTLLGFLEGANGLQCCNPEQSYMDWIKLFTHRDATEGLEEFKRLL